MSTVESSIAQVDILEAEGVRFRLQSLEGREAIHEPFRFVVTGEIIDEQSGELADVDPAAWAGTTATLTWASRDGEERAIEAVIDEVAWSLHGIELTLLPRLATLPDAGDYRVFVDQDAVAIAKTVLGEHGIEVDDRVHSAPPAHAQYLQPFEADLAFVDRILADEGIAYVLAPDGKGVALVDSADAYDELAEALPVRDEAMHSGHAVFRPRVSHAAVVAEVALRDYDFERPELDLNVRSGSQDAGLSVYEFPAGYLEPSAGNALAEARLGELSKERLQLAAETNARFLRAGAVLSIEDAPRQDMNGTWLLTAVEHRISERAGGELAYHAQFRAVPAEDGFRPDRRPAPRLGGVEHAVVTGASGQEINTEAHARVHLEHRWDQRSPGDDTSSAWARTVQPNTHGSILIPRVGWETLVGFVNGHGDEPVVLGRLYNGVTPPPEGLPAARIQSALTSRTTPGGGSVNRIATDDSAGAEGMVFDASKDYNERTENDKVTAVKANASWDVGAAHMLTIGTVFQDTVLGSRDSTIAAYQGINVGANYSLEAGDEVIIVGGLRFIRTGGNNGTVCSTFLRFVGNTELHVPIEHQTRTILGGMSLVLNGGGWITNAGMTAGVSVGGASAHRVDGTQHIRVGQYSCNVKGLLSESYASRKVDGGGAVVDSFRARGTFKTDGAATFEGGKVLIEATGQLVLDAGGVKVTMTPGGIKIDGRFDGSGKSVQSSGDAKYG